MSFNTTRNKSINVYCIDCHAKQETTRYEMKRASRVRCVCCGGNVVKRSELSDEIQDPIEAVENDLFPNHEYTEQPDGTWRSPQYTFNSDRWNHYKPRQK
jgi:ribosomal protein S27E